jgi:hypothetical protein
VDRREHLSGGDCGGVVQVNCKMQSHGERKVGCKRGPAGKSRVGRYPTSKQPWQQLTTARTAAITASVVAVRRHAPLRAPLV